MDTDEMRQKLAQLRIDAGLTQEAAGKLLDWSASTILRMENGHSSINATAVRNLLGAYGVTNEATIADFQMTARADRKQRLASKQEGKPRPKHRTPHDPPEVIETPSHFALLEATNIYVSAVLDAVRAINEEAGADDCEGVAIAVNNLANLTRSGGRALLKKLPTAPKL